MDKFTVHTGIAAAILRNNIDTDTIIPSREMRTVSKNGLADGMFAPWRYIDAKKRTPNPEFILNKPGFENTSVLICGNNFGCGSSREHAVWALKEFGICCIIAQGFGSIFFQNCISNGILPIKLPRSELESLVSATADFEPVTIDLRENQIIVGTLKITFTSSQADRKMLLEGLDPISVTLQLKEKIDEFRERDSLRRPWLQAD